MSPRRNRAKQQAPAVDLDQERVQRGVQRVQAWSDGDWVVRNVPASAATKAYRCPGCDQEVRPGVAHLVAWPADERGNLSDRRHWHVGCWRARERRFPTR